MEGWSDKHVMSQGSWFGKEDGCRTDCSILDGRTEANAKDAVKKRLLRERSQTSDPGAIQKVGTRS